MKKKVDLFWKGFIYLSWIFVAFVGIYDLFFVPIRSLIWFGSLALLVLVYYKAKKLPNYMNFGLSLIIIFNILGELFLRLYYHGIFDGYYDKILHFVNPIIFCFILYFLLKGKIRKKNYLILFCVFAVISLGVVWELIEYIFDEFFNTYMQGVYNFNLSLGEGFFGLVDRGASSSILDGRISDTMSDLFLNIFGTFVFWIFATFRNWKK